MTDENSAPPPSGTFIRSIPDGDDRERLVCSDCGFVNYENPKIVVGSVALWGERILLARRAIHPRRGYWTLLAVYSIPLISQVQLIYRARLLSPDVSPGVESLEVGLFDWGDIPWKDLAFPSVHWALNHHREVAGETAFAPRGNPTGETGAMRA